MHRAGALAALVTAAMEAGKLREAAAAVTGTQSWCAQLRQWQSAAAKARRLWERRQQGQSAAAETLGLRASLGWGECEVAIWTNPPPPPPPPPPQV